MKKFLIIMLLIFIIIAKPIFAFEIEEETDFTWLQNEIIDVSTKVDEEPKINSRYAVVIDRESKKVLYGKKENEKTKMASTTKIMTAIILMENMSKNNLTLESKVEVCKEAGNIGGSRLGLKAGDKITINDLLYGLLLCSRK